MGLHEGVENRVGKILLAGNKEHDRAQPVILGLQDRTTDSLPGAFVFFPYAQRKE